MKNTRKFLLTAALSAIISFSAYDSKAFDAVELEIMEDTRIVRMAVSNPATLPVEITLINSFNREIITEKIEAGETFESRIDFSELRNGTYTLVSTAGNLRTHKVLSVRNSSVEHKETFTSFIPVFRQDNETLTVYYIDDPGSAVDIYIDNERYYFKDRRFTNESGIFEKVFSLELMNPGSYQFSLTSGGEEFNYEFEVN